jgi:hypothetical protein
MPTTSQNERRQRVPRAVIRWTLVLVAAAPVVIAVVLASNWPFTKTKIIQNLEHFSSCEVQVSRFDRTYIPHPGYVADGVKFIRRSNGRPVQMAFVTRIQASASWAALVTFTHRLRLLQIEGLHVFIPSPVPRAIPFYPEMKDETTVSVLTAHGTILDISPREGGGSPSRFAFRTLQLKEVKKEKSISLDTTLRIPTPPGELAVRANFGPFQTGRLPKMPLSGSYELKNTDLGSTQALGGLLASNGSFRGILSRCRVHGAVRIHNFEVKKVHHPVDLDGDFDTEVDGMHGDLNVTSTSVGFLGTKLVASGKIQTAPDKRGKTESFTVASEHARVENLLSMFSTADPPAMRGPITLNTNIVLPPGPRRFLEKVQMDGSFKISNAKFLHARTQANVDKLSNRARGKKVKKNELPEDEDMPSSLEAAVQVQDGIATLSDAKFKTPGASAAGYGTYNLLTQRIDLRGKLAMEARLSKTAAGFKSVLLLPLDPFFKKDGAGAVLPIHATGTYSHPSFRVSLKGEK